MPILIKRFPEPLAAPPFPGIPPETRIAGSRARDTLHNLLLRYCNREIGGRSILIAGHRGAGKTTVVKTVIEEVHRELRPDLDAQPLFVYLHGPDLVADVDVLESAESDGKSTPSAATNVFIVGNGTAGQAMEPPAVPKPAANAQANGKPKEQARQEQLATGALRQITVALHQAFANYIGWRMQEAGFHRGHHEEAAQFRLDIDRQLEVSDLRLYWSRLGVLEQGVLRNVPAASYKATQGSLEIVAMASLSEAYTRAIAKDVQESEGQELEEKRERKQEAEKSRDRKEIVNAIAGLLSGGVAGAGAAAGSGGTAGGRAALAAVAFVLASVVTSAVLNLATLRSFSQRRSKERKVTYDDSLGSLELIVPLLIRRVQDAGLAPVFVVDELDKVERLEEKMHLLLRQLKHIVADKAFCCFLVDREYYEKVRGWGVDPRKSTGLTFFGERLYVINRHQDWHLYLQELFFVNEQNKNMDWAVTVLQYVLLGRSKMHAIDLRRELENLPRKLGVEDELSLVASEILTRPNNLNYFLYQVAVEFLLEEGPLAERIASDPTFLQPVYDALYYPLRMWEREQDMDWTLDGLSAYLQGKTGVQAGRP